MEAVKFNIYHDTRRATKDGLYPVKLRVYFDGREKYFPVLHLNQKLYLSPDDFQRAYLTRNPKNQHKSYFLSMAATLTRADDIAGKLEPFTAESFTRHWGSRGKDGGSIASYFNALAAEKQKNGDINTAQVYLWALASLQSFMGGNITFRDITGTTLQRYQEHMTGKGRSISTVSIYMRVLRAVYTHAIDDGVVKPAQLPFGRLRGQYRIPTSIKKKKALTNQQLAALYHYPLEGKPLVKKARDFWFFSYVCNGMNFKDIAELRYRNFDGDSFTFIRSKTKKSTGANPQPIRVPVTDHVRYMIDTYGNPDKQPDNYVFPIYKNAVTAHLKYKRLKRFIHNTNVRLKPVAKDLGLPPDFSTYYARHSFSTSVIRNGQSLEFVQQALGHTDMKTTLNYFAGFENDTLHEVNSKLLDFGKEK